MSSKPSKNDVPPCPKCASPATVLYDNRDPAYIRCNGCGHVWEPGAESQPSPVEPV